MALDLLALGLLAAFAAVGALRGALASALGVFGLAAGYVAGLLTAPALAPLLAEPLALPELVAGAVGGAGVFLATWLAVAAAGTRLRRAEARRRAGAPRAGWDRATGALCGAARGALVVLLLGWLALWWDALAVAEGRESPGLGEARVAAAASAVVREGVERAVGGERAEARAAARAASRPADTARGLKAVLDSRRLGELRRDGVFWSRVSDGRIEEAQARPSFLALAHDATLRSELAALGLVSERAGREVSAFRRETAEALRAVAPRLRRLREDPALERLARDPEVRELAASGDALGLLRHPGVRRLLDRTLEAAPEEAKAPPDGAG